MSGKLPTYPSPKLTLTHTFQLGQNDALGEGQVGIKLSDRFFAAAEQSERKLNFHIKIPLGKQPAFRDATSGFAAQ